MYILDNTVHYTCNSSTRYTLSFFLLFFFVSAGSGGNLDPPTVKSGGLTTCKFHLFWDCMGTSLQKRNWFQKSVTKYISMKFFFHTVRINNIFAKNVIIN